MATADANTIPQLDLFEFLEAGATGACKRLTKLCDGPGELNRELKRKFHAAVADVEFVTIEALAETAGAFVFKDGRLAIAEEPISHLLTVILNDLEARFDDGRVSVEKHEIPKMLERVVVEYMLHEVRHRTQGLAEFSDVQALKAIAGASVMAEYDTFADRDAALAMAALYAEDESRSAFLRSFREALFFSTTYFFQVFPIPANRPDKIARAMAILFMAARLAKRDLVEPVAEVDGRRLDMPLHVSLSTSQKKLAIHRGEPSKELLGVANDWDGVGELMTQICGGDFDSALETSIRIMDNFDLVK